MIDFLGQGIIVSAYLLGLLLAALTGSRWEQGYPDQVMNGLFIAIGIAAIFSVNLQLQTWLNLIDTGIFDIWSMGLSGARPYANLGQPNQLATLLLWGVLAAAWALTQKEIGVWVAVCMSAFLLTGIALTQSRTAWLGLLFLVACSWGWRALWRSRWVPWAISGLFIYFCICYFSIHSIGFFLGIGQEGDPFRGGFSGDLRFPAWKMLMGAALERPWFGYGWTEIGRAQFEVAESFPVLFPVFAHSHNLFLDLVLWLGIPLGLAISVSLMAWYVMRLHLVACAKDAILVMFLGVVGIHAMLEFPLHYGYFLFPAAVAMGVLNHRLPGGRKWTTLRWPLILGWVVAAVLLSGIIRDYFRVESSLREVRFEVARIGTLPIGKPPEVLMLTQLRENIVFMRYEVKEGMGIDELAWLKSIVISYPSGGRIYKVAKALALNGQSAEAVSWLRKICRISSPTECALIQRAWLKESRENALMASVSWPSDE
ncbi:MAG TPA: Wzy polymerase domain-containing protein [Pseudorhodoferax sp.]|nr:Wzy polymerase domain-containing protein [Pseudorhodoferax sp.]